MICSMQTNNYTMKTIKIIITVLVISTVALSDSASAQEGVDGSNSNAIEDNRGDDDHGNWGLLGLLGLAGLLGLRKNKDHNHVNGGHRV